MTRKKKVTIPSGPCGLLCDKAPRMIFLVFLRTFILQSKILVLFLICYIALRKINCEGHSSQERPLAQVFLLIKKHHVG